MGKQLLSLILVALLVVQLIAPAQVNAFAEEKSDVTEETQFQDENKDGEETEQTNTEDVLTPLEQQQEIIMGEDLTVEYGEKNEFIFRPSESAYYNFESENWDIQILKEEQEVTVITDYISYERVATAYLEAGEIYTVRYELNDDTSVTISRPVYLHEIQQLEVNIKNEQIFLQNIKPDFDSYNGMYFTVYYQDGSQIRIDEGDFYDLSFSPVDGDETWYTKCGTHKIKAQYQNITVEFTVTIKDATELGSPIALNSTISTSEKGVSYYSFTTSDQGVYNISVQRDDDDGDWENGGYSYSLYNANGQLVTEQARTSYYRLEADSDYTIVLVKQGTGRTNILVENNSITSIEIKSKPSTTEYIMGYDLSISLSGIELLVTYNDGTTEIVTDETANISPTMKEQYYDDEEEVFYYWYERMGTYPVEITYQGHIIEYEIEVVSPESHMKEWEENTSQMIEFDRYNAVVLYHFTPSKDGSYILDLYRNGEEDSFYSNVTISSEDESYKESSFIDDIDNTAVYELKGGVTYTICIRNYSGNGGVELTATLGTKLVKEITITSYPQTLDFVVNRMPNINFDELEFRITYMDGTVEENVPFSSKHFSYTLPTSDWSDSGEWYQWYEALGIYPISITHKGVSTTFDIEIKKIIDMCIPLELDKRVQGQLNMDVYNYFIYTPTETGVYEWITDGFYMDDWDGYTHIESEIYKADSEESVVTSTKFEEGKKRHYVTLEKGQQYIFSLSNWYDRVDREYSAVLTASEVAKVELKTLPKKVSYIAGMDYYLDISGLQLLVYGKDGSERIIESDELRLDASVEENDWYNMKGTHTAYVLYCGHKVEFPIEVVDVKDLAQEIEEKNDIKGSVTSANKVYYTFVAKETGVYNTFLDILNYDQDNDYYIDISIYREGDSIYGYMSQQDNRYEGYFSLQAGETYVIAIESYQDDAEYVLNICPSEIESIKVVKKPSNTNYLLNIYPEIIRDGLSIELTLKDGKTKVINYSDSLERRRFTFNDPAGKEEEENYYDWYEILGKHTVSFTYMGIAGEFDIEVCSKEQLANTIEVGKYGKLELLGYESSIYSFQVTDDDNYLLQLKDNKNNSYSSYSIRVIDEQDNIMHLDKYADSYSLNEVSLSLNKGKTYYIQIINTNYSGENLNLNYLISNSKAEKIEVLRLPSKVDYILNEENTIDFSDMLLKVYYQDGRTPRTMKGLPTGATYKVSNENWFSLKGEHKVIVSLDSAQLEFTINVKEFQEIATSLQLNEYTELYNLNGGMNQFYCIPESDGTYVFDYETKGRFYELTTVIIDENGNNVEIQENSWLDNTVCTATLVGGKVYRVHSYVDGSDELKASLKVTREDVKEIKISKLPSSTKYPLNGEMDVLTEGMEITLIYNDGSTKTYEFSKDMFTVIPPAKDYTNNEDGVDWYCRLGEHSIQVMYHNLKTSFQVEVCKPSELSDTIALDQVFDFTATEPNCKTYTFNPTESGQYVFSIDMTPVEGSITIYNENEELISNMNRLVYEDVVYFNYKLESGKTYYIYITTYEPYENGFTSKCKIEKNKLKGIEVKQVPYKQVYGYQQEQKISNYGLEILLQLEGGESIVLPYNDNYIHTWIDFDGNWADELGAHTVNVSFFGATTSYDIEVKQVDEAFKKLVLNEKMTETYGDYDGVKYIVQVPESASYVFEVNSKNNPFNEFEYNIGISETNGSGVRSSFVNTEDNTLAISFYLEQGKTYIFWLDATYNMTDIVDVTMTYNDIKRITFEEQGIKKEYLELLECSIDLTGGTLVYEYRDGSKKNVVIDENIQDTIYAHIKDNNADDEWYAQLGSYEVEIFYKEYTFTYVIEVVPNNIKSVELIFDTVKKSYLRGLDKKIRFEDLKAKVTYENNKVETISVSNISKLVGVESSSFIEGDWYETDGDYNVYLMCLGKEFSYGIKVAPIYDEIFKDRISEMKEDSRITVESEMEYKLYQFTPNETMDYTLYSSNYDMQSGVESEGIDAFVYILDEFGEIVGFNDDSGANSHFKLTKKLESGKRYYYAIGQYGYWDTPIKYNVSLVKGKDILTEVSMNQVKVAQSYEQITFTGDNLVPTIEVSYNGVLLQKDVDYKVTLPEDSKNVGQKAIVIEGIGSYIGTRTINYQINAADISKLKVTLSATSFTYDEKDKKPTVTVGNLKLNTDFVVAYPSDCKNVGTKSITVTAKANGNYTGTIKVSYKVTAASLDKLAATLAATNYTYDGAQKKPAVTIKGLVNGKDYSVEYIGSNGLAKVGKKTVKIVGKGNYSGTKSLQYKINAKSITKTTISSISNQVYTGKVIKPTVTIKDKVNGKVVALKLNVDYSVSYKNNKEYGKATVTITGKGNYTGTKTISFTIGLKKITIDKLTSPKTKQVKVTWKKDSKATGYEVVYATNKGFTKGKKTVTVKKNSTVSATIGSLKKGTTYYVKIRSYKVVNGKKHYSDYSNVKSIKCK